MWECNEKVAPCTAAEGLGQNLAMMAETQLLDFQSPKLWKMVVVLWATWFMICYKIQDSNII
jgi:hypothetical protein